MDRKSIAKGTGGILAYYIGTRLLEQIEELLRKLIALSLPTSETTIYGLIGIGIIAVGTFFIAQTVYQNLHGFGIKRVEGVQAHVFFPVGTPDALKTLKYHKEHYHHRLIINHKTTLPKAYFLPTDSFGWKLIEKYPDIWVSEDDPNPHDAKFTEEWCKANGFHLVQKTATKYDLRETTLVKNQTSTSLLEASLPTVEKPAKFLITREQMESYPRVSEQLRFFVDSTTDWFEIGFDRQVVEVEVGIPTISEGKRIDPQPKTDANGRQYVHVNHADSPKLRALIPMRVTFMVGSFVKKIPRGITLRKGDLGGLALIVFDEMRNEKRGEYSYSRTQKTKNETEFTLNF